MAALFHKDKYIHMKGAEQEPRQPGIFPFRKREEKKQEERQTVICPKCRKELDRADVVVNHYVCTACGSYFRVRTNNRLRMVCDRGSFLPWFEEMEAGNPLNFPGYEEKLAEVRGKTGLREAVTVGRGEILGESVCLGICDSRFLMGSMGHAVGEKIASAVERATRERLPVVLFCCSGGARMQEGILSLMQMAKTAAALKKHSDAGLLYVSVLTDPTTGGVTASFAMLGDLILAEPGALIGFAGPRVIEQTIGQKLPEGFQSAEFQVGHGFADRIVERDELKATLYQILSSHRISMGNRGFACFSEEPGKFLPSEPGRERMAKTPFKSAWQKVKEARSMERPCALAYIDRIFDGFLELHGDRCFGDDKAVVGGLAWLYGQPVTVIGIQKGSDGKECAQRNYGMASPEGYRKALRLMKQAEKFHRPIICFISTSGAYPGVEAEERGQGEAIARNLFEMSGLRVPVLAIVTGEGGSGGALGLAVGNEVWMLENATYSVLSPEGFASILWKDGRRAQEAAEAMGITAEDLKRLSVIETIVPEYGSAGAASLEDMAGFMKFHMAEFLKKFDGMDGEEIASHRYMRFRKF